MNWVKVWLSWMVCQFDELGAHQLGLVVVEPEAIVVVSLSAVEVVATYNHMCSQ